MKTCKKCGIEKDSDKFPLEKRNRDGLAARCRDCEKKRVAEWDAKNADKRKEYRQANKERISATHALYYTKNSELIKARSASSRKENAEKLKVYFQEYAANNSAKIVERVREWRRRNPGKKAIHNQNRRARKMSNGGKLSPDIAQRLMILQKGKCAACRCKLSESGIHLDHVIPLSRGGENSDTNVQLLCPTCNTQKNCSHPIDFMQRKGFLL